MNIGPLVGTSATVTLPTSGATIYVQLWTDFSGGAIASPTSTPTPSSRNLAAAITSPYQRQHIDWRIDHLQLDCGLRRGDRILSLDRHNARRRQPGEHRSSERHQRDRDSAHQRSHDLRAALDEFSGGAMHSPTATPTPSSRNRAAAITSPTNGSTLTRRIDHLQLERGLRRGDRLLPLDRHIVRHRQSGEHRSSGRHQRDRESAHQRSHDLRAALDELQRRRHSSPTATPTPSSRNLRAAITSPTNGSTLTGASTTFNWSAGSGGVTGYYLWVGTTSGAANLVNIGPLVGTSATVTLPTSGATIYVQLWTNFSGGATASPTATPTPSSRNLRAAITSPTNGSTLTGASTTFTWSAGSGGVTGYYLWVGTSAGTANLVNIGPLTGTSATVTLPTNGATIYVQLWTKFNGGAFLSNSYTYTEAP